MNRPKFIFNLLHATYLHRLEINMCSSQEGTLFINKDNPNFHNVVRIIFNNWTALRLAIEHGMGGPPFLTQIKLENIVDSVIETLQGLTLKSINDNTDWCKVSDVLEMKMDSEFSTILEDNSSDEVAVHIGHLYKLYRLGDFDSINLSLESLPRLSPIFVKIQENSVSSNNPLCLEDKDDKNVTPSAPTDDGWTYVTRK